MPALQLRSGQAPVGIQYSLSLGNSLWLLFRQQTNYAQSSANSRSEEPALQPQVVLPLGGQRLPDLPDHFFGRAAGGLGEPDLAAQGHERGGKNQGRAFVLAPAR